MVSITNYTIWVCSNTVNAKISFILLNNHSQLIKLENIGAGGYRLRAYALIAYANNN